MPINSTRSILLILLATIAFTSVSSAEDLLETYTKARLNDATYQQEIQNWQAAKLGVPLAQTAFRPNINANGTIARQRDDLSGSTQTRDDDQLALSLDLSAYNKPKRIAIDQAREQVSAAEIQLQRAEDELILRVAERYFSVLAAQDNYEVARLQKVSIGRQMDLASERLDVGLGTRTDLFDARARFQQADSDLITAQVLIDNSIQSLSEVTGEKVGNLATLSTTAPLDSPQPESLDAWLSQAHQNNLLLAIQQHNLSVAELEISRQKTARWPRLDASIRNSWSDGQSIAGIASSGTQSILSAGVTLSVPVYLGGVISLSTQQAGYNFSAQQQATESLRREITSTATSAYLAVTSGIRQVQALDEAVKAGSNALKAKEEGFSAGLTTNLDVLDAQRDLSRSRTDYLVARYNFILSVLRLENVVGELDEDDIRKVNSWLQ